MKKFVVKFVGNLVLLFIAAAFPAALRAQGATALTRIITLPDGMPFKVDGQNFTHATSAIWPVGSKHTLFTTQYGLTLNLFACGGSNVTSCAVAPGTVYVNGQAVVSSQTFYFDPG